MPRHRRVCRVNSIPQWVTVPPQVRIGDARALPLLEAAHAAAPTDLTRVLRLARTLVALDRPHDAMALLEPVIARADAPAEALALYGHSASQLGRLDIAIAALRRAAALDATGDGALAGALRRAGQIDEALGVALAALARDPGERAALSTAAKILAGRGEMARLGELCRALRQRGSRNGFALAYEAVAAVATGDPALGRLIDRDAWFGRYCGVADAAFNAALADEILRHPALASSAEAKATRGNGVRIHHLETLGGPLARALLERVRAHVDDYVHDRLGLVQAPLIERLPERIALNAWALVLRDDGEEDWHIHPTGWISGVYYVCVPPAGPEPAGHIGFGPVGLPTQIELTDFPRWTVAPEAGELLLFPSWFGHRTWPTQSAAPRISVAFDVVPTR